MTFGKISTISTGTRPDHHDHVFRVVSAAHKGRAVYPVRSVRGDKQDAHAPRASMPMSDANVRLEPSESICATTEQGIVGQKAH